MNQDYFSLVGEALPAFKQDQINQVLRLLDDGNTVPFIARYRKEQTHSLDEVAIRDIQSTYERVEAREERRQSVLKLIGDQGKLTMELETKINRAKDLQTIEDLYAPYKKKRQTKAEKARQKGLQPLADWLLSNPTIGNVHEQAEQYLSDEVASVQDALAEAHEIVAEWIGEQADYKEWIRRHMKQKGELVSTKHPKGEDEEHLYEIYYDFHAKLDQLKPYQILAMNRAEKEGILSITAEDDEFTFIQYLVGQVIQGHPVSTSQLQAAIQDGLERFILPSIEREIRRELTDRAEDHAIDTFSENLYHLLMQQPLKGKTVLGWDPAYRTGSKLAVMDPTGRVLAKTIVYPTPPHNKTEEAEKTFLELVDNYQIDIVAIGNGTASRESEAFVSDVIKKNHLSLQYVIVNEAGASVYSASKIAREEFPDYQVEERSAVSIGRRLQDPLAELVKVEPQAIGVGQYQHDVSQTKLRDQLDFTVEMVVNRVGVNVNTASVSLLEHVAGITPSVAKNIVTRRNDEGIFQSREELKDVKRLGPKAYEQAAGFLRVPASDNILDNTGIHPESYQLTQQILTAQGIDIQSLNEDSVKTQIRQWNIAKLTEDFKVGRETLQDIQKALLEPGIDPRDHVQGPTLRQDVLTLDDLEVGMPLEGTVRNVVDFGAFVDVGVKQDGLVHISRLSKKFVKNASDVVSVGDIVNVWVVGIDKKRKRIDLSMVEPKS
ncbi:MAG: Tex family protein [Aerococcus sp.]|nr:Tex family protein [Aerococcus sp.]